MFEFGSKNDGDGVETALERIHWTLEQIYASLEGVAMREAAREKKRIEGLNATARLLRELQESLADASMDRLAAFVETRRGAAGADAFRAEMLVIAHALTSNRLEDLNALCPGCLDGTAGLLARTERFALETVEPLHRDLLDWLGREASVEGRDALMADILAATVPKEELNAAMDRLRAEHGQDDLFERVGVMLSGPYLLMEATEETVAAFVREMERGDLVDLMASVEEELRGRLLSACGPEAEEGLVQDMEIRGPADIEERRRAFAHAAGIIRGMARDGRMAFARPSADILTSEEIDDILKMVED